MRCIIGTVIISLLLTGCSSLPNEGPSAGEILKESATASEDQRYYIVDISDPVIRVLGTRAPDASLASFGDFRGSYDLRVGVGDVITVTIWEAGSGGLFSAPLTTNQFTTGSRSVGIPEQVVGRDGVIIVPYAGRIRALGRTTSEIQRNIEHQLDGKAVQPQVLVNISKPLANTVTVLGEATGGGRVPLSVKGDRVLDVIASAGGVRAPVNESFIQMTRNSRTVRVAMSRVTSNPHENIFVRPNDVLTVIRDPQVFTAYGATGRNAEIPFEAEGITLAQALSKAGGLLDSRADPEGVFVFRYEPVNIASKLSPSARSYANERYVKTVYRLNLRDPNNLFLASQFRIFNHDLVYVANAPLTDAQKVMQIFNLAVTPISTSASVITLVK